MTRQSRINTSQLDRRTFALFLLASISLFTLSGCGDRLSSHGHAINQEELSQISLGSTTKADILELLGQPSFDGAFDERKLYYSSQIMVQPVASVKLTHQRIIYVFTVDANDLLKSIDVINKDDGLKIAHVDDKTPTPGDTFGLLEQVFSNLKRRQPDE